MKADSSLTTTARLLAGLLALHLVVLRPPAELLLPIIAVLLIGEVLRVRKIFVPVRWNVALISVGLVATLLLGLGMRASFFLGAMAGMAGATAILSRVTPMRGLWVLFCLLILLLTMVLTPFVGVGGLTVVGDVILLYLMSERVCRPPEVEVSFWPSLLRSLRVAVPVALIVSTIFWLFPNLSVQTTSSFTGFSGDGHLSPDGIASLAQSRRIALVARFPKGNPLPSGSDLYWRGQVLNHSAGLRWTDEGTRTGQKRTLQETAPDPGFAGWSYHLDLTSSPGGIMPVLDHVLFVKARRGGVEIVVFDRGAAVLSAVGYGALSAEAMSSSDPMKDAPISAVAQGDLAVPENFLSDSAVAVLAERILRPGRTLSANLESVANYFRDEGFTYSLRPGRVKSLQDFLFQDRKGFCGHYAAAAATLLRLGGVPARIVTGFRGGEWNPWLRTLTVRDSDAHAWIEAWDERAGVWRRFDPTLAVAPEEMERINQNMKPASWSWYRRNWSYGQAKGTELLAEAKRILSQVMASDVWENVQPALSALLLLLVVIWGIRKIRSRPDVWVLEKLERRAAGSSRSRQSGETPLAWLGRLQRETENLSDKNLLEELARAYEAVIYRADELVAVSDLRRIVRRLLRLWRTVPPPPRSGW